HINQFCKPPRSNWRMRELVNQFRKRSQICDGCRAESFGLREPFVDRDDVILRRKFRFLRINRPDPIGERFLSGNLPAQTGVVEMTMRVNQTRQESLLAKIDNPLARISRGDFGKFSNIDNGAGGSRATSTSSPGG